MPYLILLTVESKRALLSPDAIAPRLFWNIREQFGPSLPWHIWSILGETLQEELS